MVQLMLSISARPGRRQEMVQALRSILMAVRVEPGCGHCALYEDADQPDTLCYLEEWGNRADLERQIRSVSFTRLLAVMETAIEPPVLEFRFVSETRGLDFVEAVRTSV